MVFIVNFIFIIIGWFFFLKKKKHISLVILFLLITKFLNISFLSESYSGILNIGNLVWLYLFGMMGIGFFKNKKYFSTKNDALAKIVILVEIYFIVSFLLTAQVGNESFRSAFTVFREESFYLFYFFFRNITTLHYIKFFKTLFKLSLIWAVLFFMQLIGIQLLVKDVSFGYEVLRYRNIPDTSLLMAVLSFIIIKRKKTIYYVYSLLFIGPIILSLNRGMILSLCVVPLILFIEGYKRLAVKNILLVLILVIIFSPYLIARFNTKDIQKTSVLSEIKESVEVSQIDIDDIRGQTFKFRVMWLIERTEYMIINSDLLFGIGSIHEDSPNNKFDFLVGAVKSMGNESVVQQIVSRDQNFVTSYFRYGIIGLVMLILLYYAIYKKLTKHKNIYTVWAISFFIVCLVAGLAGYTFNMLNTFLLFSFLSFSKEDIEFQRIYI